MGRNVLVKLTSELPGGHANAGLAGSDGIEIRSDVRVGLITPHTPSPAARCRSCPVRTLAAGAWYAARGGGGSERPSTPGQRRAGPTRTSPRPATGTVYH